MDACIQLWPVMITCNHRFHGLPRLTFSAMTAVFPLFFRTSLPILIHPYPEGSGRVRELLRELARDLHDQPTKQSSFLQKGRHGNSLADPVPPAFLTNQEYDRTPQPCVVSLFRLAHGIYGLQYGLSSLLFAAARCRLQLSLPFT